MGRDTNKERQKLPEAIRRRHSVRKYKKDPIPEDLQQDQLYSSPGQA